MKLTTIIGTVIAAIGMAACGSAAAPTVSPTHALTVASTPTAAPSASDSPSPSASASPSPTDGACGDAACASGVAYTTTCAAAGTAQGGSVTITFTAGAGQTEPMPPASVTIDGNAIAVTSNPFTFGPLLAGVHTFNLSVNGSLTIPACDLVTVLTTCSATTGPTGSARFTGVTVGDALNVMDSTDDLSINSNPFVVNEIGVSSGDTYVESSGGTTIASGTFSVAACA